MSALGDKERLAIKRIRLFYSSNIKQMVDQGGYYVSYSGGKDSEVLIALCKLAGVQFEIHHNLTTVDAPETVYHVRSVVPRDNIHQPEKSMWQLIVDKGFPPTRVGRYCCEYLKEHGGDGRIKMLGLRAAESSGRAERTGLVNIKNLGKRERDIIYDENRAVCYINSAGSITMHTDNEAARDVIRVCNRHGGDVSINPIYEWTDSEVWQFLTYYGIKVNPLYSEGCKRIGCIGCPLAGGKQMKREFARWPKYRENYVKAFDRMVAANADRGRAKSWFTCGEDVMRWWCGDDPRQITLDDVDIYWLNIGYDEEWTSHDYD